MSTARIYLIQASNADVMLIKATNQAQALRHVARSIYTVRPATALEVAENMETGLKVEDATREPTDLVEEAAS